MGSAVPKTGNDLVIYVKPTPKAYRFVTTVEGSGRPLQLDVDCDSDREATLIALSMACELSTVEVWDGERLVRRVPSVNEALKAFGAAKMSAAMATGQAQR